MARAVIYAGDHYRDRRGDQAAEPAGNKERMAIAIARQEWDAHWPQPYLGTLGVADAATFGYPCGVFLHAMTAEFGRSRSQFPSAFTVQTCWTHEGRGLHELSSPMTIGRVEIARQDLAGAARRVGRTVAKERFYALRETEDLQEGQHAFFFTRAPFWTGH
jgi:hypothetical protein